MELLRVNEQNKHKIDLSKIIFQSDGTPINLNTNFVLSEQGKATRAGKFKKKTFFQTATVNDVNFKGKC